MGNYEIVNKASIHIHDIDSIIRKAKLPNGKLLLIFNDFKFGRYYGATIPRILLDHEFSYRAFIPYKDKIWDCGIDMSPSICKLREAYPAYFTYILGHELGHAHVCLTDAGLHVHSILIQDIGKIPEGRIKYNCQLPHEILFDQFGIYIAEQFYPRYQLNKEIKELPKILGNNYDSMRFELLLSLSSTNEIDNQKLRNELVDISKPYKKELIELWKADEDPETPTQFITDYEALFKKS